MLETIYKETFPIARRAARRILQEPADCDAVVQQVFADLVSSRALRASHEGEDVGAWISGIARHRALDHARRERRLVAMSEADLDREVPERPSAAAELRGELARLSAELPEQERRLVELRFVAGMTQVEAATALGVPRTTLEDWERRIKRLLRDRLVAAEGP